ncbi:MAG TPA: protein kinase [Polyangiales bacterium]|nr:protein kinase [Polyangiales bacterium]
MFRRPGVHAPLQKPPSAAGGEVLIDGRYSVERALGSGGMAQVWQVRDGTCDRELALKRLSSGADRRAVALFEREYYTLTSLHHPNIVTVYDYGTDVDGPYYTMELLHGSDVSSLAPLAWPEVCRILRDIASALALIHARRYIHRDISARNVWRTSESQLKLIDFGTLAPFGRRSDVAGTPPFIAPEALHGRELDQRADLYSLGALGYWLLTGLHAFPARSLNTLDQIWTQRPRAASHRVAELQRKDLPGVPPALDALLDTLLSLEARARLNDAAEVIDALCTVAGLAAENAPLVLESYLKTPVLVGRARTIDVLRSALERARESRGASLLIEAPPSMGRTRVLSELAVQARMLSAIVLQVEATGEQSAHAAADRYAQKLLDALPSAAQTAAQPYAAVLGHVSSELRERLGVAEADLVQLPKAHGEARMRIQAALAEWFIEVARQHTLVLLADDLHDFDAGSIAWLAALGRQGRAQHLLIVATVRTDTGPPAIEGLRRHATVMTLGPLAARDTEAMLRSVFGEVQHLRRLADLVTQRAEGNPGHTLDLITHLVQQQLAQYVGGAWVLPVAISAEQLPQSSGEVFAARLRRLSPAARALGQALSVRAGSIPFEACEALAEMPVADTFAALEELVGEGVLVGSTEGYRFTRDAVRAALRAELDDGRTQRVHRISGELLLLKASASPLEKLEGGLHLLLGGDYERGTDVVARAAQHYGLVDLADVGQAAPALERALQVFEKLGRSKHELLSLYAPLALAGYYAERRYADRYAEPTLALLQDLLGLNRARVLRRWLGNKLGLFLALGGAAFGFWRQRRNPRVPSFRRAMMLLFNCVAALTGVCTVCIDSVRARRYANVLEPLRALGGNHVATLMHDFCVNLSVTVQDRIGFAQSRWQSMIERLDRRGRIRDMTEDVRILYLAGALYASGVMETWRDSSKALQLAQRLEDFKLKLYELTANQLRMLYYAHQGDFALSEMHRERVEVHAIQRGTAWQAETWAFGALVGVYARVYDPIGVKHCVQKLQQLSQEVPSLERVIGLAHGTYLLLRGSPEEALEWLTREEEPLEHAGWARSRGALASAYNQVGKFERARDVCAAAEALLSPVDFEYPAMNLNVLTERALADAGLGDHAAAMTRLDDLIKKFGPLEGPLTMSMLHEARLRVAATMQDQKSVEHHVACMERWQRQTNIRSLIAHGELVGRYARAAVGCSPPEERERVEARETAQPLTVVHRIRHGGERSLEASAEWILDQLLTYAGVRAGHVYRWEDERLAWIATRGALPEPSVFEMWLMQRLWNDSDEATVVVDPSAEVRDGDVFIAQDRSYRVLRLLRSASSGAELAGVLVLSEETPFDIPPAVLRVIAERLHQSALVTEVVST